MSENYKRKLIRRLEKLLSRSTSPLLDFTMNISAVNPVTKEFIDFGQVTVREFLLSIVDMEL